MKKFVFFTAVIFIITLLPHLSLAQGPDPGCDPLDPACPIDGGVVLLIIAGIGIGAKKMKNQHTQAD